MGNYNIHANTDAISGTAKQFSGHVTSLIDLINQIGKNIEDLRNEWQGSAAYSFDTIMTDWNTGASNIQTALDDITKNLDAAGYNYADLETQIKNSFTPVR